MIKPKTLSDVGERELIRRYFIPMQQESPSVVIGIGDDAAVIRIPRDSPQDLVVTTDSAPTPVVWSLGWKDYYYLGWYTVMVNVSDLAAMGSTPLCIVTAIECPPATLLSDFARFVDGVKAACRALNCPLVGGNLREGPEFRAVGTACGCVIEGGSVTRAGADEGDIIFLVGLSGLFWASYAAYANGADLQPTDDRLARDALCTPLPQHLLFPDLARRLLATSAIDVSDGLTCSLYFLAEASSRSLAIDLSTLACAPIVERIASKAGIPFATLPFGFGDWQLLLTIPPQHAARAVDFMQVAQIPFSQIGIVEAQSDHPVQCRIGDRVGPLALLDNQRFPADSIYVSGVESYFQSLLAFNPMPNSISNERN